MHLTIVVMKKGMIMLVVITIGKMMMIVIGIELISEKLRFSIGR